jgi:predicted metal-binding membrane protein
MSATNVPDRIASKAGRWPWILVIAAWGVALLATFTNRTYLINHEYLLEESRLPWPVALVIFIAVWQIMIMAMMLPSSMPTISLFARVSRGQQRSSMVMIAFLAGYIVIWTAFAVAAFTSDTFIHWLVGHWSWLAAHPWLIGATTFALAGAFQFSPLKKRCLTACSSPIGFLARFYHRGVGPAWRLGLRHGMFCLGCCWLLMLIMFGVGVGSLVWMAALTGVMVVEKAVPGGRRLSPVIGVVLFLLSALWLAHPAWLVLQTAV